MRVSRRNKKNCKTKRRTYKKGGKHDPKINREEIAKKRQDYKRRPRTPPNGPIQGQAYDDLLRDLGMQPRRSH